MSTGDELRAAVSARRDLGPEFEDAIVESFLDKMGQEVDRRVDERLAQLGPASAEAAKRQNVANGQRLALAIVSMSLGTILTILFMLVGDEQGGSLFWVWTGIVLVNVIFNSNRHKD
ncbi:hypothetical protein [Nonomuraea jiangxiensis]|uniref:Uncharacterized protein n=1 Tax=Nonomuraea jiangxiensis TaxID=633440 RepID=A0A1G8C8E0_9ACTN|nr:hypothetical protein [Nonomuraea jiangxiensis]SDH41150.1 hypothetical protein SAMN05421869_102213 [Nonomuraea jiangxiensis]